MYKKLATALNQVGRHRKEDIEKGRSGAARHNTSFKTHPTICKSIPLLFRKNDPTFQTPITLFSGADHTIQGTIPLSHYYNIIPLTLFSSFPLVCSIQQGVMFTESTASG
jgi:hypothetical protein